MRPRLVFRTHYQVHEPAYLELIVRSCTSPIRSAYKETVAERLLKVVSVGKRFNRAAAGYAVDVAKALGLLTDRLTWTGLAILLGLTSDLAEYDLARIKNLNPSRRLSIFRIMLEGDGAAIWFLLRALRSEGSLAASGEEANVIARDMFVTVYRQYLELTASPRERVALKRDLERLRAAPYSGNTGRHKLLFHVHVLRRVGLLERPDPNSQTYRASELGLRTTELFECEVPTIGALEQTIASKEAMSLAGRLLGLAPAQAAMDIGEFQRQVLGRYDEIMGLGVSLCPMDVLLELIQHDCIMRGEMLSYREAESSLETLRAAEPRRVRFHVDRQGRPAYVAISRGV